VSATPLHIVHMRRAVCQRQLSFFCYITTAARIYSSFVQVVRPAVGARFFGRIALITTGSFS